MNTSYFGSVGAALVVSTLSAPALAAPPQGPLVRIAELDIDPAHLASYQVAVKEEIDTSLREEPGVLAIYAVAEKDNPAKFHFFEIYADQAAYRKHIDLPHFKKYANATKAMINEVAQLLIIGWRIMSTPSAIECWILRGRAAPDVGANRASFIHVCSLSGNRSGQQQNSSPTAPGRTVG